MYGDVRRPLSVHGGVGVHISPVCPYLEKDGGGGGTVVLSC